MTFLFKFRYLIYSIVVSGLLYLYFTLFEEAFVLLSFFPVAIFALVYKIEHGKFPSIRRGLEVIAAAIILSGIGSLYDPGLVFTAIIGFSVTGFFILLYKLVDRNG